MGFGGKAGTGEDKLLAARLEDMIQLSRLRQSPRFSCFLTPEQQQLAKEFTQRRKLDNCMVYGGFPEAQRRVLGIFPPFAQSGENFFPVDAFTFHYRRGDAPGHRDVLGSLMALGLRRESIGDIYPGEAFCVAALLRPAGGLVLEELKKIGGVGVRVSSGIPEDFAVEQSYEERWGTVQSPRLDSLVSLMTGLSREKSAALIRKELVRHRDKTATSSSIFCGEGDHISIRGYGKYVVDNLGAPTKKGRLPVSYRKFT